MKHRFALPALLALALLAPLLSGCGKDQALGVYNAAVEAAGALALDRPAELSGDLSRAQDGYTGSYQAAPEAYTGTELLFGGTSIDKAADEAVQVSCTLSAKAGSARLFYQLGGAEPVYLLEGPGAYEGGVPTPPGSCYIGLEYEGFSGAVALSVS